MNKSQLESTMLEIKNEIERAIRTKKYKGKTFENGVEAKQALIRSQSLIMRLHEVVKVGLKKELASQKLAATMFPEVEETGPEQKVYGFIKAKDQDVTILFNKIPSVPLKLEEGPMAGIVDEIGFEKTNKSIVIGVRSQLSSIEKNFDTLMERAFAETLNLRLRTKRITLGDVYMIPLHEYDDTHMKNQKVIFKQKKVNIAKFIKTFYSITVNGSDPGEEMIYKYDEFALVLVDFNQPNPKVYYTTEALKADGFLPKDFDDKYFNSLSPLGFSKRLIAKHLEKHPDVK